MLRVGDVRRLVLPSPLGIVARMKVASRAEGRCVSVGGRGTDVPLIQIGARFNDLGGENKIQVNVSNILAG